MHAASVNPEPGSNSRNHGILTPGEGRLKSISSLIAHLLFFRVVFSLSELSRCSSHILHTFVCPLLHTYLLLFNFQGPLVSTLSRGDFLIIPHRLPFVKSFFQLFSKFFCIFWGSRYGFLHFSTQLAYFITLSNLCQGVFRKFFCFFIFFIYI